MNRAFRIIITVITLINLTPIYAADNGNTPGTQALFARGEGYWTSPANENAKCIFHSKIYEKL